MNDASQDGIAHSLGTVTCKRRPVLHVWSLTMPEHPRKVQQQRQARLPLDQRADDRAVEAGDQVAFPVPRARCPGTARSAASAGRSLIIISDVTKDCRSPVVNQFRLVRLASAYGLILTVRDTIPRAHARACAEFATLRDHRIGPYPDCRVVREGGSKPSAAAALGVGCMHSGDGGWLGPCDPPPDQTGAVPAFGLH